MKTVHKNVPVFIPHLGCPNNCVFCDQHNITMAKFDESDAKRVIDHMIKTLHAGADSEIAFFGGSFTGIDRDLMTRLLKLGRSYIEAGAVSALRCSTRPDYIDGEIIEILKEYGVKTVELGIQSTDDKVLEACKRGHTAKQSFEAMEMLKENGFSLIGQMMTGLPEATRGSEVQTAEDICRYADGARIYPIVVFKQTELCNMIYHHQYKVIPSEELISRTADVKEVFIRHNVPTIRIGLQSNVRMMEEFDAVYGGTYDEAVGEKCESEIYYRRLKKLLEGKTGAVTVKVPYGDVSKAVGHKKINKERLLEETEITSIKFIEGDVPPYTAETVG